MALFFPRYEPEDYDRYGAGLAGDDVPLDPNSDERIGLRPDWRERPDRSAYFMFNLHSLRYAYSLIEPGSRGDLDALRAVRELILYWAAENPASGRPPTAGWADEHAVSWRSITLAYFWEVWQGSPIAAELDEAAFLSLIADHARYLGRPSNYRPHHNHGLNNTLALVAIGSMFRDRIPAATSWMELGFRRAERQMADNVSADGVQLEQSGFYHCYCLRTFLEIARAAHETGHATSPAFDDRLDRMLGITARFAGRGPVSWGFPFSDRRKDPLRVYPLIGLASLPDTLQGKGAAQYREAVAGSPPAGLHVADEGGFALFNDPDGRLELVFHTRILQAPHAHQDAMGLYASHAGRELLAMPSTLFVGERSPRWRRHFIGPKGHNSVCVDDRAQRPPAALRDGALARLAESHKVKQLAQRSGLADALERFRSRARLDLRSLQERLSPRAGEVVGHGDDGICAWVIARHRSYPRVTHTRSVVRLDRRWLVVRDVLAASEGTQHRFRQQWHFSPDAKLFLDGPRGQVEAGALTAGFRQLATGAEVTLHHGTETPEPLGWYAETPAPPRPTPLVVSEAHGSAAEFLWVLEVGDTRCDASLLPGAGCTIQLSAGDFRTSLSFSADSVAVAPG